MATAFDKQSDDIDKQPDDFVGIYLKNKEDYSKLSEPLLLKPVTPLGSY